MFIVTGVGKNFGYVTVLDTDDNTEESISVNSLLRARNENGLEFQPMYLRASSMRPVQQNNGYIIEKRGGGKIMFPTAMLQYYVNVGLAFIANV